MSAKLLEIKDLHVQYRTDDSNIFAVTPMSAGEALSEISVTFSIIETS